MKKASSTVGSKKTPSVPLKSKKRTVAQMTKGDAAAVPTPSSKSSVSTKQRKMEKPVKRSALHTWIPFVNKP